MHPSLINFPAATRLTGVIFTISILLYFLYTYATSSSYHPKVQPHWFPLLNSTRYTEVIDPNNGRWPWHVYKSSSLRPLAMNVSVNNGKTADGYLFFTPKIRGAENKGLIDDMAAIWSQQENEIVYAFAKQGLSDFNVQMINGKPRLTLWSGKSLLGHGYGELLIMDDKYVATHHDVNANIESLQRFMKFEMRPGLIDFHEHRVTDRGTILVVAYNNSQLDLTPYNGPQDGWMSDSVFLEIDVATNEILFQWSALDHFKLNQTRMPLPSYQCDGTTHKPYDFFHLNSMQEIGDDAFLISSRHFWAVYLISRKDGSVIWELNGSGEGGDFGPLPTEAQFRWQHHARAHNVTEEGMVLSLFDNHAMEDDTGKTPTRGLSFGLTFPPDKNVTPTILLNLNTTKDFSMSQGSYESYLDNSNHLMNYGPIPVIREYGPEGDLRWEGRFGLDNKVQSYRVFKGDWHATPWDWGPHLVLEQEGQLLKGYVSWNGATDVERWHVYHVDVGERLVPLGHAVKEGFETVFEIPDRVGETRCILVRAVQGGEEVRESNMACLQ